MKRVASVEPVQLMLNIFLHLKMERNCPTNDSFSLLNLSKLTMFVRFVEVMKDDVRPFDCFVLVIDRSNEKQQSHDKDQMFVYLTFK